MIGQRVGLDELQKGMIVRRFGSSGGALWQVTEVSERCYQGGHDLYREFCAISLSSTRELYWEMTSGFEIVEAKR